MNNSAMYSGSTSQKLKMYTIYWLGYILLFSLIQGLPTADFLRALSNEFYSVFPKILFVLLIVEVAMPVLFFQKKKTLFIFTYILSILFFAFIQRLIDNYIIIAYNLTEWKRQTLHSRLPATEWDAMRAARAAMPSWMARAVSEVAVA